MTNNPASASTVKSPFDEENPVEHIDGPDADPSIDENVKRARAAFDAEMEQAKVDAPDPNEGAKRPVDVTEEELLNVFKSTDESLLSSAPVEVTSMKMDEIETRDLPLPMNDEMVKQFAESENEVDEDDEAIQADPREIEFLLSAYMTRVETLSHKNIASEARVAFLNRVVYELQAKLGLPPVEEKPEKQVLEHLSSVAMGNRIDVLTHRNLVKTARIKFFEQYIGAQSRIIEDMSTRIRELGDDPQPILNAYFAPQNDQPVDDPAEKTET